MTAKIINLNGLDDEDDGYSEFLESLKTDNVNAVFLVEKEDGSVTVGCNFKNRRDLVFAIYQLQSLAMSIAGGEE